MWTSSDSTHNICTCTLRFKNVKHPTFAGAFCALVRHTSFYEMMLYSSAVANVSISMPSYYLGNNYSFRKHIYVKNKAWLNGHSENRCWSTGLKVYCILCVTVTVVFLSWQWKRQSIAELVTHRGHQLTIYNFVTTLTVNNRHSYWWIHSTCVWNTPCRLQQLVTILTEHNI